MFVVGGMDFFYVLVFVFLKEFNMVDCFVVVDDGDYCFL